MYAIILCEGETDAILISYYLINTLGYGYIKRLPNNMPKLDDLSKIVNWYKDVDGKYIAICPVGGSAFQDSVIKVMDYNRYADKEKIFQKMVLVMDNDDESVSEHIKMIGKYLACRNELSAGVWETFSYVNDFSEEVYGKIACILQPADEYGALETFVLQVICENDIDATEAVNQAKVFVKSFKSKKYLQHRRDRVKANLAVSLSVMYPSRTFTTINEFLENMRWNDYQLFQKQFKLFENINII